MITDGHIPGLVFYLHPVQSVIVLSLCNQNENNNKLRKMEVLYRMDARAAKHSTPEHSLIITNNEVSIKRLSASESASRKSIVITKCLCDPCPRLYTDIFKMILIVCKDPSHKDDNDCKMNQEIQYIVKNKASPYRKISKSSDVTNLPCFEQISKRGDKR